MFKEILLDENIDLYTDYYDKASFKTIYHHPQFLLAEEKAEKYQTYLYIYEENEQFVILPSIKRRVNDIEEFENEQEEFFDLITPHEYSGVIAREYNLDSIRHFFCEFASYCEEHHIIFSFVRFNPYSNENEAAEKYCIIESADQVWLDCNNKFFISEFSKSRQRDLKNAIRRGLVCEKVEKSSNNKKIFTKLYKKSMSRLQAKNFFYFSEKYFECIFCLEFTDLFFTYDSDKENVLAAAIVLKDNYNKIAYYHLSCRRSDVKIPGAMELLIATFSEIMRQENYQIIHLGGGATNSLRQFKEKFSMKRTKYYIGYCIFDNDVYSNLCDKYCKKNPGSLESHFFPMYRSKE